VVSRKPAGAGATLTAVAPSAFAVMSRGGAARFGDASAVRRLAATVAAAPVARFDPDQLPGPISA
jgi:hypothetical protein